MSLLKLGWLGRHIFQQIKNELGSLWLRNQVLNQTQAATKWLGYLTLFSPAKDWVITGTKARRSLTSKDPKISLFSSFFYPWPNFINPPRA